MIDGAPNLARRQPAASPGAHRPAFWRWSQLEERKLREIAEALTALLPAGAKVSHGTVFNLMLPWSDQRRAEPSDALKAAIETLTGGAVPAATAWLAPARDDGDAG